ncbi:MAG: rhodanese-like domain-containing protein [Campylobacterales bacterium]|nr:rhodanese-like domain-containing protein [Campylobacterales bacterium]
MKKIVLLFVSILLTSINLFAAEPETPNANVSASQGAKYISVADAKKLQESGAIIVDSRKPIQYAKEHIKGAVLAYYDEKGGNKNKKAGWDASKDKFDTTKIPTDKSTILITYCNGIRCWKSYKAAVKLTNLGYTNVYWMRDGIPAWKSAGLPIE